MDLKKYIGLKYDINGLRGVNCWTLLAKIYSDELNLPLQIYQSKTNSKSDIATEFKAQISANKHGFASVSKPKDLDVLIFTYTHNKQVCYHCGLWFGGKVLHAKGTGQSGGVWYDKLKDIDFDTVRYYRYERN